MKTVQVSSPNVGYIGDINCFLDGGNNLPVKILQNSVIQIAPCLLYVILDAMFEIISLIYNLLFTINMFYSIVECVR